MFWAVDLQNDFMNQNGALPVPNADNIKPQIKDLLKMALYQNIPVYGSYDAHHPDDPEFETFPPHCISHSDGMQLFFYEDEEIDEYPQLSLFPKSTTDIFAEEGFTQGKLNDILKIQPTIVVFGVATEYCVKDAVLGYLERGINVIVIEDAIQGIDPENVGDAIIQMQLQGAQFMTLDHFKSYAKYEEQLHYLRSQAKEYLQNNGLQTIVLGISGGIDSALTAAILEPVAKDLDIPLVGIWIGIESTEEERQRAFAVGNEFCDEFIDEDLSHISHSTESLFYLHNPGEEIKYFLQDKIRIGNIKARLRMIYLYHEAHTRKGIVMSTDNRTEYELGFWTLHGDVGDLNLLHSLYKTEVYELANYLMEKYDREDHADKADTMDECIQAVPTDGLGITDSDLDQFQAESYEEVDSILKMTKKEIMDHNLDTNPVYLRHIHTNWKRSNPINLVLPFYLRSHPERFSEEELQEDI